MELRAILFAPALPVALFASAVLSVATSPAGANVIPMGQAELTGGTTRIGEIDPSAIPYSGPHASGTVCNRIPSGLEIGGLDFHIDRGSAKSISVRSAPPVRFDESGTARVAFAPDATLTGNQCAPYTIHSLSGDGSEEHVVLTVSPTLVVALDGASLEVSTLPEHRLDSMSDRARHGIAELRRAGVVASVSNADPARNLLEIEGAVTFPGTSAANLSAVHVFDSAGVRVPPARVDVQIEGATFTVSRFLALEPGSRIRLVLVFDEPLEGVPMRAELQARFGP